MDTKTTNNEDAGTQASSPPSSSHSSEDGFAEFAGSLKAAELATESEQTNTVEPDALERALNMLEDSLADETRMYAEVQRALAERRNSRTYVIPVDPNFTAPMTVQSTPLLPQPPIQEARSELNAGQTQIQPLMVPPHHLDIDRIFSQPVRELPPKPTSIAALDPTSIAALAPTPVDTRQLQETEPGTQSWSGAKAIFDTAPNLPKGDGLCLPTAESLDATANPEPVEQARTPYQLQGEQEPNSAEVTDTYSLKKSTGVIWSDLPEDADSMLTETFEDELVTEHELLEQTDQLAQTFDQSESMQQAVDAPPTEGVLQAAQPLARGREVSINDTNFVGKQDQAFKASGEIPIAQTESSPMLPALRGTGEYERRPPRMSQEFLRIKREEDEETNAQEISQRLRSLPLPSADEKKLPPAKRHLTIAPGTFTKKRGLLAAGLLLTMLIMSVCARTARSYVGQAYEANEKGDYKEAIVLADHSLALNKNGIDKKNAIQAHLTKAWALIALKRQDDSRKEYEEVMKLDPNHKYAIKSHAAICRDLRRWNQVVTDLDHLFQIQSSLDMNQWFDYAEAMRYTGQHGFAAEFYSRALNMDKHKELSRSANMGMAISMRRSARPQEAARVISGVLAASPSDMLALRERAWCYLEAQDWDNADKDLQRLAARYSKDHEVHLMLAKLYFGQNKPNSAKHELEVALKLKPDSKQSIAAELEWMNKTLDWRRKNPVTTTAVRTVHELQRAYVAEDSAVNLNQGPEALFRQGMAQLQQGRPSTAAAMLAEAAKKRPRDMNIRRSLALALAAANKPGQAARQFSIVWSAGSWSARDQNFLADAYFRCDMTDCAIDAYQTTLSRSPGNFQATCGLAKAFSKAGLRSQALAVCNRALPSSSPSERSQLFALMSEASQQSNIVTDPAILQQRRKLVKPIDLKDAGG